MVFFISFWSELYTTWDIQAPMPATLSAPTNASDPSLLLLFLHWGRGVNFCLYLHSSLSSPHKYPVARSQDLPMTPSPFPDSICLDAIAQRCTNCPHRAIFLPPTFSAGSYPDLSLRICFSSRTIRDSWICSQRRRLGLILIVCLEIPVDIPKAQW